MRSDRPREQGFTLLEMIISLGCTLLVGGVAFYLLTLGSTLYAKGYLLNCSNIALRYSLDRMNAEIGEATALPELINVSAGTIQGNQSGAAAGVRFDKYLGAKYVVVNPGGASGTGLSAASTVQLQRTTDPLGAPPTPFRTYTNSGGTSSLQEILPNDVLLIDGTSARYIVTDIATTVSNSNSVLTLSVRISPPATIQWFAPSLKTAYLVREEAFVASGGQLNFYPTMEGVTNLTSNGSSNNTNTSNQGSLSPVILSRDLSTSATTPFSAVSSTTAGNYIMASLTVSVQKYSNYLANKQSLKFNNYVNFTTVLRQRNSLELASP